jgi:hypothetical protein
MVRIDGATVGQRAMEGVRKGFDQAGESGQKASKHFEAANRMLGNVINTGARFLGMMAGVSVAVGGVFAAGAIKASTEYEALQARLEAVTGSAETMARKLEFAQRVANPSSFTFKQLADATVTLEAFGVNAERALPTVARLGMAFQANDEQLQSLIRGFGDLSTGKFFESDLASSFGLNRSMFEEKGIKFDGTGQLESSATETFRALEEIVNERYGSIFDKMAGTGMAKLASLSDVWEKFQRTVGDGIMKMLGPSLETLTQSLAALTDSGVLKETMTAFADGFLALFNATSNGDGILRFVAGVASAIGHIPEAIGKTGQALSHVWEVIDHNMEVIWGKINDNMGETFTKMGASMEALKQRLMFDEEGAQATMRGASAAIAADRALRPPTDLMKFDMPQFSVNWFDTQDANLSAMQKMLKPTDMTVPDATGNWLNNPEKPSEDSSTLKEIADNTHATATKLADMHRQVIGTGDRGQIGATPAELRGGGARAGDMVQTPYGPISAEFILRMDTPGMQRFIRVENARSNGRGFNPR